MATVGRAWITPLLRWRGGNTAGGIFRRFSSVNKIEDRMQWGFVKNGQAVKAYRNNGANPRVLLKVTDHTLRLMHLNRSELEEGAKYAYQHLAAVFEKASPDEWRDQHRSVMSPALAEEFAQQASLYAFHGCRPELRIENLEARIVFAALLPDNLDVRFDESKYLSGPFANIRRNIGLGLSLFGAVWRTLNQPRLNEQIMCISLLMHVTSHESFRLVDAPASSSQGGGDAEQPLAGGTADTTVGQDAAKTASTQGVAEAEDWEHLLLFEARFQWEDFVHYSQVPVSVAGTEGQEARMRIKEADPGPSLSWKLSDFNNHLVRIGKRREFNLKLSNDSE